MDLVIRLKRPRNVDPFEALVFASKRRKTENEEDGAPTAGETIPTILKLAGTLSHHEEDISSHIAKARLHDGLKSFAHLKSKDVIKRMRESTKKASKESRFKVINFTRAASNVSTDHNYAGSEEIPKSPDAKQFTIIDVVHDLPTENSQQVVEDDGYVYSLYYADAAEHEVADVFVDSVVRNGDDSDDSVGNMMEGLKLGLENELSSDDEEYDLPYGVDREEVEHLGRSYASYKARVTEELKGTDDDDDYENEETSEED
ncbi:hypothetical protein J437_LFUL010893 [Ladona fulva]|uniref:RNA polymerase II nuclear localization protein SLC7A6OS n=1 Tax=Ladona fulva TaxID=123851 RepID=A0A8K0P5T8_LADFU|nr:hypothetical protein J437_LFUL010893 [Ladona fulva]